MDDYDKWNVFSVLKRGEGGMGGAEAIRQLKYAGINASLDHSIYVGHVAVVVHSKNKRVLRKAERILFGGWR